MLNNNYRNRQKSFLRYIGVHQILTCPSINSYYFHDLLFVLKYEPSKLLTLQYPGTLNSGWRIFKTVPRILKIWKQSVYKGETTQRQDKRRIQRPDLNNAGISCSWRCETNNAKSSPGVDSFQLLHMRLSYCGKEVIGFARAHPLPDEIFLFIQKCSFMLKDQMLIQKWNSPEAITGLVVKKFSEPKQLTKQP